MAGKILIMKHHSSMLRYTTLLLLIGALLAPAAGKSRHRDWRVHHVTFHGNHTFKSSILLDRMITRPSWLLNRTPFDEGVFSDDLTMLRLFYRNQGFLDATATAAGIARDSARMEVDINLDIVENERTILDSIHFISNGLLGDSLLSATITSRVGDPYISTQIDDDARTILALLTQRGHLDAAVEPSVQLNTTSHRASATFSIHEGPCIKTGSINISGLQKVRTRVVEQELTFTTGDTLSSREIDRSTTRLYQTDLFQRVQILAVPDSSKNRRDTTFENTPRNVMVKVTEDKMFQVEIGGGYSTADALRASVGTSYRNLFGLGKRLNFNGKLSSRLQYAELGYADPRPFGIPLQLDMSGYYGHHNEYAFVPGFAGLLVPFTGSDEYAYHANIGGLKFSLGISTPVHISYELRFRLEHVEYLPGTQDTSIDSINALRTRSLALTVAWDTRNDILNPAKGLLALATTEIAGIGDSRENQFIKTTADFRFFQPLGSWAILSTGLMTGYMRTYGTSQEIPPQERFRAGGSTSIRGFSDNMIGPLQQIDSTYVSTGGRLLLVLHPVEFRFPLYKTLWGAVFCDGGNVWGNATEFHWTSINWSVGTGLRLNLPLGVIRIDWGWPLKTNVNYPNSYMGALHFDIGQAF